MRSCDPKEIVINGVRYNAAICINTHWDYAAEWWNKSEYHKHPLDAAARSSSQVQRKAIDEIHKAHFKLEPLRNDSLANH